MHRFERCECEENYKTLQNTIKQPANNFRSRKLCKNCGVNWLWCLTRTQYGRTLLWQFEYNFERKREHANRKRLLQWFRLLLVPKKVWKEKKKLPNMFSLRYSLYHNVFGTCSIFRNLKNGIFSLKVSWELFGYVLSRQFQAKKKLRDIWKFRETQKCRDI